MERDRRIREVASRTPRDMNSRASNATRCAMTPIMRNAMNTDAKLLLVRELRFAIQDWIAAQSAEVKLWKSYLLTFMFEHMAGSEIAVRRQMERELERFYRILLTRVVRNPKAPSCRDRLARLFAFPDRPVPKVKKSALRDVAVNDGLHYHAALLLPRSSRLRTGLVRHVEKNESLYLGNHGKLRRIHVARVRAEDAGRVADYLLKTVKRESVMSDAMLLLPRAVSELPERAKPEGAR